jgi:hypothetical protein
MKCVMLYVIMLVALTFVLPASAETFILKGGKEIEGALLRTAGSKITLKTNSGVSTYDVTQFSEETRNEHFKDLKPAGIHREEMPSESTPRPAADPMTLGEAKPKAVVGLMIAGVILCAIGSLWFIVAGFAESVGWGIALILFNGIAGLAFLILHWDRAKSPILTYFLGICLIIASVLIET